MKYIIIFLIILIPSTALAFSGKGSGTAEDPYQITNVYQLQEMNDEHPEGACYVLMNDIDASETRNWNLYDNDDNPDTPEIAKGFEPISFRNEEKFDGKYNVIKNLYIYRTNESVGLFSHILGFKCAIVNLGLVDCDITGADAGSICCHLWFGDIMSCFSTGKVNGGYAGGFCCNGEIVQIEQCYSQCEVSAIEEASSFIGLSLGGFVSQCYATGKTTGKEILSVFGGISNEVNGSVWDIEKTGSSVGGGSSKGLTTVEMMNYDIIKSFFWEFDIFWCIDDGKDYPKLRAFGDCPSDVETNNSKSDKCMIDAYPNPFTNATEIRYSISKVGSVNIQVFNSLGISVKEFLNEAYSAEGTYKVIFDGSTLPTGIYFITLKTGGQAITKHLLLLR